MSESDEQSDQEDESEPGHDEPVSRCLELDVEETPFVEAYWVRVEDVGRILVHRDRSLSKSPNFATGPGKHDDHREDGDDGKGLFSGRVLMDKLPKAKNGHLRESNKNLAKS